MIGDLFYLAAAAESCLALIRSSSVEEQAAVNRLAVGSNPTSGAISLEEFCTKVCGDE